MTLAGRIYVHEDLDARGAARTNLGANANATLRSVDNCAIDVAIADLSTSGCLITAPVDIKIGQDVTIGIPGLGVSRARIVRKDVADHYGCAFIAPLEPDAVERVNAAETVVPFARTPWGAMQRPMPTINRYPRRVRALVLLVGAVGSWALLLSLF